MNSYGKDRQTNRVAWLLFSLLLMTSVVFGVRRPLPPVPEPVYQGPPAVPSPADEVGLGDMDTPGDYAARHPQDVDQKSIKTKKLSQPQ
jgi:hypothetical protein